MFEVALIGAGNMGESMLKGWLEANILEAENIIVSDRDQGKREALAGRYSIAELGSNKDAVSASNVVFLAVKPPDCEDLLKEIAGSISNKQVVLSIVTGLKLKTMRQLLGTQAALIRAMPNIAAQVRSAVSAYTIDPGPEGFKREKALELLKAVGEVVEVEEVFMDLVTALSGSGPAYFFLMVESLTSAGMAHGLSRSVSKSIASETLWGAAKLIKETGCDARELIKEISSPGGTTLAALEKFNEAGFDNIVSSAVTAALLRAKELSY